MRKILMTLSASLALAAGMTVAGMAAETART